LAALEAHACSDSGFLDGRGDLLAILPGKRDRFFDDQMFAGARSLDRLFGMEIGVTAD
jgi:hypothetical protein